MKLIRNLVISAAALILSTAGFSQDLFYSIAPGHKLSYKIVDDKGALYGTYDLITKASKGTPEDGEVTFIYNYFNAKGETLFKKNDYLMRVESKDGERKAHFENLSQTMKTQDYMIKGDVSTLNSEMKVGSELPESYIKVCIGFITTKMYVKERKCVAMEEITTPAGTFECYKLTERQVVKFMGYNTDDYLISWYAAGIGCVKQEIYDEDAKLRLVHELQKITE